MATIMVQTMLATESPNASLPLDLAVSMSLALAASRDLHAQQRAAVPRQNMLKTRQEMTERMRLSGGLGWDCGTTTTVGWVCAGWYAASMACLGYWALFL